jgi:putative membrane protein
MLKKLVRRLVFSLTAVYLISLINPGFIYSGGAKTLFLAGFVMFFLDTIVEPILKIVFFPINFLTRGLFSWVIAVALLYALSYFVPAVKIVGWTFQGVSIPLLEFYTVTLPKHTFDFWQNLIFISFSFTLLEGFFNWLCD